MTSDMISMAVEYRRINGLPPWKPLRILTGG